MDDKIDETKDAGLPDLESQREKHQPAATPEERNVKEKGTDSAVSEPQYLTGYRLLFLNIATTTVAFLMLLDSSILSSVTNNLNKSWMKS
jgi:hypothetical protein